LNAIQSPQTNSLRYKLGHHPAFSKTCNRRQIFSRQRSSPQLTRFYVQSIAPIKKTLGNRQNPRKKNFLVFVKGGAQTVEKEMPTICLLRFDELTCLSDRQAANQTCFLTAIASSCYHGPKRWRYSPETRKALTISAFTKLPLNSLNLPNQKL
jgi:hypothetical protein